jgi:hypothetical protein
LASLRVSVGNEGTDEVGFEGLYEELADLGFLHAELAGMPRYRFLGEGGGRFLLAELPPSTENPGMGYAPPASR